MSRRSSPDVIVNVPLVRVVRVPVSPREALAESRFDGLECVHLVAKTTEVPYERVPLSQEGVALCNERMQVLVVGRATRRLLRSCVEDAVSWAEQHLESGGDLRRFACLMMTIAIKRCWEEHCLTKAALQRELRDERLRDAAALSERMLHRYLAVWDRRVKRFQIAYPRWCRMPGRTAEEFRSDLSTALLEAIRDNSGNSIELHERAGCEATFRFLDAHRSALRKRRKMFIVTDLSNSPQLYAKDPTAEEIAIARERAALIKRVFDDPPNTLTTRQKQWLGRFRSDFMKHGTLNEARVAAEFKRNRSSASRMRRAVCAALREAGTYKLLLEE
jgi:hypothetical protein